MKTITKHSNSENIKKQMVVLFAILSVLILCFAVQTVTVDADSTNFGDKTVKAGETKIISYDSPVNLTGTLTVEGTLEIEDDYNNSGYVNAITYGDGGKIVLKGNGKIIFEGYKSQYMTVTSKIVCSGLNSEESITVKTESESNTVPKILIMDAGKAGSKIISSGSIEFTGNVQINEDIGFSQLTFVSLVSSTLTSDGTFPFLKKITINGTLNVDKNSKLLCSTVLNGLNAKINFATGAILSENSQVSNIFGSYKTGSDLSTIGGNLLFSIGANHAIRTTVETQISVGLAGLELNGGFEKYKSADVTSNTNGNISVTGSVVIKGETIIESGIDVKLSNSMLTVFDGAVFNVSSLDSDSNPNTILVLGTLNYTGSQYIFAQNIFLSDSNGLLAGTGFIESTGMILFEHCNAVSYEIVKDGKSKYYLASFEKALENIESAKNNRINVEGNITISNDVSLVIKSDMEVWGGSNSSNNTISIKDKATLVCEQGSIFKPNIDAEAKFVKNNVTTYAGIVKALDNAVSGDSIEILTSGIVSINGNYTLKSGVKMNLGDANLIIPASNTFKVEGELTSPSGSSITILGTLDVSGKIIVNGGNVNGTSGAIDVDGGDIVVTSGLFETNPAKTNAAYWEIGSERHFGDINVGLASKALKVSIFGISTYGDLSVPEGKTLELNGKEVKIKSITLAGGSSAASLLISGTTVFTGDIILGNNSMATYAPGTEHKEGSVSIGDSIITMNGTKFAGLVMGIEQEISGTDLELLNIGGVITAGKVQFENFVNIIDIPSSQAKGLSLKSSSSLDPVVLTLKKGVLSGTIITAASNGEINIGNSDSDLSGSVATVKCKITIDSGTLSVYSGGDISGSTVTAGNKVELYVVVDNKETLYGTQYAPENTTLTLPKTITGLSNMDLEIKDWYNKPIDGSVIPADSKVGDVAKVYALTQAKEYAVTFEKIAGVEYVLDGGVVSGKVMVNAGIHDFRINVLPGYEGNVKFNSSEHAQYNSEKQKLTISGGDSTISVSGVGIEGQGLSTTNIILIVIGAAIVIILAFILYIYGKNSGAFGKKKI